MASVHDVAFEALRDAARRLLGQSAAVILFGSIVRGEETPSSDIDVLVVRPGKVSFDDDDWTDALMDWAAVARDVTGRPVDMLDAEVGELGRLLARPAPTVWRDIADGGMVLSGQPLAQLVDG